MPSGQSAVRSRRRSLDTGMKCPDRVGQRRWPPDPLVCFVSHHHVTTLTPADGRPHGARVEVALVNHSHSRSTVASTARESIRARRTAVKTSARHTIAPLLASPGQPQTSPRTELTEEPVGYTYSIMPRSCTRPVRR